MIIIRERKTAEKNAVREARFRFNAVKNFQSSGTKAKITIEVDLAQVIKDITGYDLHRYNITPGQLNPRHLAEVIAHRLDWEAYALSVNDDHTLSRVLERLNDDD
jgi:hypothetical protein